MICLICSVNSRTGYVSKGFLIPIRAGKALISILNSLIISLPKKALITG